MIESQESFGKRVAEWMRRMAHDAEAENDRVVAYTLGGKAFRALIVYLSESATVPEDRLFDGLLFNGVHTYEAMFSAKLHARMRSGRQVWCEYGEIGYAAAQ